MPFYIFSGMTSVDSTLYELLFASLLLFFAFFKANKLIRNIETLDFIDISIFMTIIFFGLGPWICFYYRGYSLPSEKIFILFKAYFAVAVFIIGLMIAKLQIKRGAVTGNLLSNLQRASLNLNIVHIVISFCLIYIIRAIINIKYGALFSLTAGVEPVHIPYWINSIRILINSISYGLIFMAASYFRAGNNLKNSMCLSLLLIEMFYSILQGRRWVLIAVIALGIVMTVREKKISPKTALFGIGSIFVLSLLIFPFFINLRHTFQYEIKAHTTKDVASSLYSSVTTVVSDMGRDRNSISYKKNMEMRALFQIRWICWIIAKQEASHNLMLGRSVITSIINAIPHALFPYKKNYLDPELTVSKHYHMLLVDLSGNWPGYGLADFGLIGCLLYGILLGKSILLFEKIGSMYLNKNIVFYYFICGGLLYLVCMVEVSITILWVFYRTVIILWLLLIAPKYLKPQIRNKI